ncbi:MAG: RNA-directed DNA polymerase, partial [Acidobacteriota bacterium]
KDFVNFLDRRARRFKDGRVHAARLDVRGFYDRLTRSVVLDALRPKLSTAFGNATPGEFLDRAPLFRPGLLQVRDRQARVDAILDWLVTQSFDYRYFDPGGAALVHSGDPDGGVPRPLGLPQGPDLSAYLANTTLFGLDAAVSRLARDLADGDGAPAATYARYVDDIVIIASSASQLRRLREEIEVELAKASLELSPKTKPMPAMDVQEFRRWLTDKRGGLGVSDPFGEPNPEQSLFQLGALADAGNVDRSQSLSILHSPDADRQSQDWSTGRGGLRVAMKARDLRFGEFVAAARILWRGVAERLPADAAATVARAVEIFSESWKAMNAIGPPELGGGVDPVQKALVDAMPALAALQGLERFLARRMDRSFRLTPADQDALSGWRIQLARLTLHGLADQVVEQLGGAPGPRAEHLGHMFYLRTQVVVWTARQTLGQLDGPPPPALPRGPEKASDWPSRSFLISNFGPSADASALRGDVWSLLHAATARLRHFGEQSPAEATAADPLQVFAETVKGAAGDGTAASPTLAVEILEYWTPGDGEDRPGASSSSVIYHALSALMNLAASRAGDLLSKRPALLRDLLEKLHLDPTSYRFLPSLPATGSPGLLAIDESLPATSDRKLLLVASRAPEVRSRMLPAKIEWREVEEEFRSESFCVWTAPFPSDAIHTQPLKPFDPADPKAEPPTARRELFREFALRYDKLASFCRLPQEVGDGQFRPVPVADNLFRTPEGLPTGEGVGVLGFLVDKDYIEATGFCRVARGAYRRVPIPLALKSMGRTAVALADFYGRGDLIRAEHSVRLSPDYLSVDIADGGDWISEAFFRTCLLRLSGRILSASDQEKAAERARDFPKSICWLLTAMRRYPGVDAAPELKLAALLTCHVWGPAWKARLDSDLDKGAPGFGTHLLAHVASSYFDADARLDDVLPRARPSAGERHPKRRHAYAWFRVGQRLEGLLDREAKTDERDNALHGLVAGIFLWSLSLELRAGVIEQIGALPDGALGTSGSLDADLSALGLDDTALLHRRQIDAQDGLAHILGLRGDRVPALGGSTPLGGLVALGVLVGLVPSRLKGRGLPNLGAGPAGHAADLHDLDRLVQGLRRLAFALGVGASAEDLDGPYDDLIHIANDWSSGESLEAPLEFIHDVDRRSGFTCTQHVAGSSLEKKDGQSVFDSSRGSFFLATHQVMRSNLTDDRTWEAVREGQRNLKVWSETWLGDRLLSVCLVNQALSRLAGSPPARIPPGGPLPPDDASPGRSASDPPDGHRPAETAESGRGGGGDGGEDGAGDAGGGQPERSRPDGGPPGAPGAGSGGGADVAGARRRFRDIRRASWRARSGLKPERHVRVALLQWFGGHTYAHPSYEASAPGEELGAPTSAVTRSLASATEHRRREMLKPVLRACDDLGVEALLIPEYTVRPETVEWLDDVRRQLAPRVSLWAGTYKIPFRGASYRGSRRSEERDRKEELQALLTVLPARRGASFPRPEVRPKRYPAISIDEEIKTRVDTAGLEALMKDSRDPAAVESFIFELICAEAFMLFSPTNMAAFARETQRSWIRHGLHRDQAFKDDLEKTRELCAADLLALSDMTNLTECTSPPRRSIAMVPAMTGRIHDYALFAQSSFFANGITTVLANAVGHNGGRSCFIGQNSWDGRFGEGASGPYHGVTPGIFRQAERGRGYLSKTEEALVVADIDPNNALRGSPNPEALPPGLSLVAHIPILTPWRSTLKGYRPSHGAAEGWSAQRELVLTSLLDALAPKHSSTTDDPNPDALSRALESLTELQGQDGHGHEPAWLEERQKAYALDHGQKPQAWPPPVALDFLTVDLGPVESEDFPPIEVPAARAGGGVHSADSEEGDEGRGTAEPADGPEASDDTSGA